MRRVAILFASSTDEPDSKARVAASRKELQQLGWSEGRNLRVEVRSGDSEADVRKNTAELLAFAPDVILTGGTTTMA